MPSSGLQDDTSGVDIRRQTDLQYLRNAEPHAVGFSYAMEKLND
jgi:hypothetical protein